MDITGQNDLTVHKSWRLNERMYGALQGLNKKRTVMKYGEDSGADLTQKISELQVASKDGFLAMLRSRRRHLMDHMRVHGRE